MKKMGNRGFTLVEVLAVIVIVTLISAIAIPNVLSTIGVGKSKSEEIMIDNIKTASSQMYEEVEFSGTTNASGDIVSDLLDNGNKIKILKDTNYIVFHLQTLVDYGFLTGNGVDNSEVLTNPKTGKNIGNCEVKITKSSNDRFSFSNVSGSNCPNLG